MSHPPRFSAVDLARALGQEHPPTDEQREIIEAPLEPLLVVAGAGSGKTETMTARVVWLVANHLVAPEQVLGLTFTRKAAGELAERVGRRLATLESAGLWSPPQESEADGLGGAPTISTYHAYAGRLVREGALRLGYEKDSRLLSEAATWQLAHEVVVAWDGPMADIDKTESTVTNAVVSLAGELAEHLLTPADVDDFAGRTLGHLATVGATGKGFTKDFTGKVITPMEQQRLVLPIVERYREIKRERSVMDFSDQMALAAALATRFPDIGSAERERFRGLDLAESVPRPAVAELLDEAAVRAHEDVVERHVADELVQQVGCTLTQIVVAMGRVEIAHEREAVLVDALGERLLRRALGGGQILAEELEVAAEVEDEEILFVVAVPVEARAQTCSTPDHLPELRLRPHRLEEDEVGDLGHVDAGVEHVDADGDLWHLVRFAEFLDEVVGVRDPVRDDARERPGELRPSCVEALRDEVGMALVLREDDRLGQRVAAGHLVPGFHEQREHLVDSVGVEQKPIDLVGVDGIRRAVVTPVHEIPHVLLSRAQVVVTNALAQKRRSDGDAMRRHEVAVIDGPIETVGVRRHPVFQVEEAVGVVVDLVLRRRGETEQQRVEVLEQVPVLGVHAAVRFVDDDEIERSGAEGAVAVVVGLLREAHHRLVGGGVDAPRAGAVFDEVDDGHLGHEFDECSRGLFDERSAVGEEQDGLGPIRVDELLDDGGRGARLTRTGRHDEQGLALLAVVGVVIQPLHDLRDGLFLHRVEIDVGHGAPSEHVKKA